MVSNHNNMEENMDMEEYIYGYEKKEYMYINELKRAEIVYRFTQVCRLYGHTTPLSEGIPDHELPKLTKKLLETFQNNAHMLDVHISAIDHEVQILTEHLMYFHNAQLPYISELPIQWEIYKDISEERILIKRGGPSAIKPPINCHEALRLANQISHAKEVVVLLLMELESRSIESLDLVCPLVRKAILVLQAALYKSPSFILELMNVDGADDNIVKAECDTAEDVADFRSASPCLYNLGGTTSFMISTMQCLHWVPELKQAIVEWCPSFEISCDHLLTIAARDLFSELDEEVRRVEPRKFLQLFRAKFSKSSQLDGLSNQQDAKECWMQLLDTFSQSLQSSGGVYSKNPCIVKDLFEIKLTSCRDNEEEYLLKPCQKHPTEKASTSEDKSAGMLKRHLSGEVDHLHEGPRDDQEPKIGEAFLSSIGGLSSWGKEEEHMMKPCQTHLIEKTSMLRRYDSCRVHGRTPEAKSVGMLKWRVSDKVDHLHEGLRDYLESEIDDASPFSISGLPRYLTIEFLYDGQNANYKINLTAVDVYDLCLDELRQKLKPAREAAGLSVCEENSSGLNEDQDIKMSDASEEAQLTGVYDLFTVLAHSKKPYHDGSTSQGHYDAIVKYGEYGEWIMYRDEQRHLVWPGTLVDIMRAGGDGQLAPFICMYKARTARVN